MDMQQMSQAMHTGQPISRKSQIKLMVSLSIPAIFEQLVTTLMSYIDTAMVGSLGYQATAAIGVVVSTIWLFTGIVNAAAVGFSVQVAQYLGAGREKDSRNVLTQAILFNVVFGIGLAVIALILGQFLPQLLGAEAAVHADAKAYFCVIAAFLPFNLSSALYSSILRCSGNARLPSFLNIGMCLLDVVFNFILIYPTRKIHGVTVWGAGMGVKGAALGTGLATACIGLLMLVLLLRRKGPLQLQGDETWRFTGVCLRNAFRLSTPAALERITMGLAQIVMTSVVTGMGAVAVAANYVTVQAESICYLPAFGVASAATALVGQSIGAGRPDMAKRFAYSTTVLGCGLVTATASVLFFTAPFLAGTLTPDTEVIALSTQVLRIVVFAEPLFALSTVVIGALHGAGDSTGPFLLSLCSRWGIRISTILLFTHRFGLIGLWATMSAELVFRGMLFLIRLVRGRWLHIEALQ